MRHPAKIIRARALRQAHNPAEALLWTRLKAHQLAGCKFVRQYPFGPYFADFACRTEKLIVEVDGSQHCGSEHDRKRDAFMQQQGFAVLRFWSGSVLADVGSVCETILYVLEGGYEGGCLAPDLRFVPWVKRQLRVTSPL